MARYLERETERESGGREGGEWLGISHLETCFWVLTSSLTDVSTLVTR